MGYQDILYEQKDGVAWITLNRPQVFNAFRTQTLLELSEVLTAAGEDRTVGVIVLTGAGGKAFCSGGDIEEMRSLTPETGRIFVHRLLRVFQLIRTAPQPVLAGVDGYCLGGGNELNLVCDLTVATEKSMFGQVGPTVGSTPVLAGTQFLPRLVGDKRAKEIIFLCQRYSAREALEMGWINKVVPDGTLAAALKEWCERILGMSPQALRIAKVSLNFEADQLYPSFTHGIELLAGTYGSPELVEGMSAFLEKRAPDFNRFRE